MSFESLGLTPELLRAVADQGYTEPTPVQREAIPLVLAGRDLLAGAQTGTGKTAAFVLPILQRLADSQPVVTGPTSRDRRDAFRPPVRVLVLTPTRELALQVEASVRTYGAHRRVRSTAIYGGVGFDPQVRALRTGPAIVVATPGRLLDHANQRTIDLSHVEVLVLDEADRMLDMGFIRDIRRVLDLLPARRQNLLFSATFSEEIRGLASGLLHEPAMVQVTPRNTATELVTQVVFPVDRHRKRELLSHLIRSGRIEQALVFTRTKHGANHLAEQLQRDGIAATAIHGNKSQGQRVKALNDFKAGRASILVATEVASRGLDIEDLPHVVNFELPMVAEDYVHRIGRTGRAGATGDAISLVCVDEQGLLREIEALLRHRIPSEAIEGFEPDRSIRAEPIRRQPQGRQGPRQGAPRAGGRPGRPFAPRPVAARPAPAAYNHGQRPAPAAYNHGQRAAPVGPRPGAPAPGGGRHAPRRGPAPVGIGNGPVDFRSRDRSVPDRPAQGRPMNGHQPQARGNDRRPNAGGPDRRPRHGQPGPSNRPTAMPGERLQRSNTGR
jgi:ATP-dependent RNA helicase RhlE